MRVLSRSLGNSQSKEIGDADTYLKWLGKAKNKQPKQQSRAPRGYPEISIIPDRPKTLGKAKALQLRPLGRREGHQGCAVCEVLSASRHLEKDQWWDYAEKADWPVCEPLGDTDFDVVDNYLRVDWWWHSTLSVWEGSGWCLYVVEYLSVWPVHTGVNLVVNRRGQVFWLILLLAWPDLDVVNHSRHWANDRCNYQFG